MLSLALLATCCEWAHEPAAGENESVKFKRTFEGPTTSASLGRRINHSAAAALLASKGLRRPRRAVARAGPELGGDPRGGHLAVC